ncbi:MAG TPA: GNAT family N-acetyltransferase [Anaerolineaceae bacterium]|nr:GNAT family N-acetyltransferase [Anaerolineaceae bacterium]
MTEIENLVRFLPWDSDFFGQRIARVLPSTLRIEDIQKLDAWCQDQHINCLYFLSTDTGGHSLKLVEESGFRLADLRVTFLAKLDQLTLPASHNKAICLATAADIADLRAIAAHNHVDTRFYADPHFERSKCDELYQIWIEKSINDPHQRVFTYKPENKALGYVSVYPGENNSATIGLVGIAKVCQGQGIGSRLINHCLHTLQAEACTQVEVVTQGRNTIAIQLYEKCGFRIKSIQTWFHKWYE